MYLSDYGSVTQIESHTYMLGLHGVTHFNGVTDWSVLSISWGRHRLGSMLQEHEAIDKLQRQFSLCDVPVFAKKFFCEDKPLYLQHFAWNSAGLNSCVSKQGQSDLSFQCRIVYTSLANCIYYDTFSCLNYASYLYTNTRRKVFASTRPRNTSASLDRP